MSEGNGAMRFSYCMLPDYPLKDSIETIRIADELGFHAVYSVDETWHKDWAVLFAAAADKTQRIRFGPNVTHVFLREPTLIVQSLATLDELTDGRVEAVVSTGNFGLMQQYGVDWAARKPLSRLKEALYVMRTFLDEGKIDFKGDFFQYSGLFTAARPVQERMPLLMGGMKGPRSFIAAGELADGMHHALSYSREAYDYVVENVKKGADKAGRDFGDLDIGAWVVTVVAEDSAAAKQAARILVAFYISSMPEEQLARHDIELSEVQPVVDALGKGDRRVLARAGRAAVGGRDPGGVRGEDQARHRARRREPHDPRALRRAPRRVLLGPEGRERAGRRRPAQAGGRADDPRVRVNSLVAAPCSRVWPSMP